MFDHCEAVIFDCDGVLVDSEYLCHLGLSQALQAEGIPESAAALFREFQGVELALIFSAVVRRHGRALPADFETRYRAVVAQLFEQELRPTPGIEKVLQKLTLPYCVASNGPRAKMEHSLGLTGLRDYFGEHLYSAYEVGIWKPDPGLFLAASSGLGVEPSRCLVVEDSAVGLQAALAAGMSALHYRPGGGGDSGDVPVVAELAELPELLALNAR